MFIWRKSHKDPEFAVYSSCKSVILPDEGQKSSHLTSLNMIVTCFGPWVPDHMTASFFHKTHWYAVTNLVKGASIMLWNPAPPATGAQRRRSLEILSNEQRPKTTFSGKETDTTCRCYKDKGRKWGKGQCVTHSYTVQRLQVSVIHAWIHIALMWAGGQF